MEDTYVVCCVIFYHIPPKKVGIFTFSTSTPTSGWYPSCKKKNSANFRDNLAAASAATSKKTHKSRLIEQKEKTQNSQDLKRKYEKTSSSTASSTIGLLKKHFASGSSLSEGYVCAHPLGIPAGRCGFRQMTCLKGDWIQPRPKTNGSTP